MDVTEILQFANELVLAQTGKHLDDIQEIVIKGVWEGQTYEKIAAECNRSESHIRDIGYKLWQVFSEQLEQDINKRNFRSTLSRLKFTSSPIIIQNNNHQNNNHHFNFCSSAENKNNPNSINTKNNNHYLYHNLTLAPKINQFYGREIELKILSDCLKSQNTRLISILGLLGIGKTTLVKQFVDLNLQLFDIIIWKSIKLSESLDSIFTETLTAIDSDVTDGENKITQFFNVLRHQRCLIILDDVQELFISEQLAGQFKTEYKNYQKFFTMMTEIENQSSLILISQEQCQEMVCLDEELYPIKSLEINGLHNSEFIKDNGLKNNHDGAKIIDLYEGNPAYLKDILNLIKIVFAGQADDFLKENSLIITKDIKSRLTEIFNRLSILEQKIVVQISKLDEPVSREDLKQVLPLSSTDLINGLQSLSQRYLLKRIEKEKILFNLSPVFKQYIRTNLENLELLE
ncbi:NB-ARC domain-containing protein [Planktothrix pseudagardhii]|uniref:WD repeat-containing protein alr2800 n=1 Tax=Planktothrix pseudagardhii TaxID=132604 RepID=A0A9W4CGM4_9CYAN|nr:NB-ARC domain-containing protein [Planktothrix pseudagardhii]CAD5928913.1 putative WD repeat-containing protein alr2800 [Planktothrix pseudagardhii]